MYENKDNIQNISAPPGALWTVWLLWVLIYAAGYGAGALIGAMAAGQVLRLFPAAQQGLDNNWAVLASGLVWAATVGFVLSGFQSLLLHYHIPRFDWRRWVFASVLGLMGAVGLVAALQRLIADQANTFIYFTLYLSVLVAIAGGILGWAQHLALRDYLPDENRWIAANCIMAAVSTLLVMLWFAGRRGNGVYLDFDFFWLGGAIFLGIGLATGFVLYSLLRHPQPE
ncbi:MAG TPA: hypothetical protein VJ183_18305 [Chloroflexia bacterium]|nr:hypothetical protein [Chloroflexia bacterium]